MTYKLIDTSDVVQMINDVSIFLKCWLRDLYNRAHFVGHMIRS